MNNIKEIQNLQANSEIKKIKNFHRLNIPLEKWITIDDYTAYDKMDIIFNNWLESNKNLLDSICDELIC
jgi:hypothetical protein